MARATEILGDRIITVEDSHKDYGEMRYISVGFLDNAMVVLVWTPLDDAFRTIGLRKANERERLHYQSRF